jgi:hypothetical protein
LLIFALVGGMIGAGGTLRAATAKDGAKAAPSASRKRSYVDFLREMTDFDRLSRLHPGVQGGEFTSWDRNGKNAWGANGDAGQYLRTEPDGEAVMMDADGPGCIFRVWSANPQGRIRVYLDGATTPTYEWDFEKLFTGDMPPFIKPIVFKSGDGVNAASDCYLPIPFKNHIKITADRAYGQYYHFNYLLYPKTDDVSSFHLPLSDQEQAVLKKVADAWASPGRDPKPKLPGQKTITKTLEIQPGQTVRLASLTGAGVIRALRAQVESSQRYAWRKLVLRGTWDGAKWPQVLSPLGLLFGFDWNQAEYGSLVAGCLKGHAYFYYPMPYRKSASLELTNFLEQPAKVTFEIEYAPVKSLPADSLYFYARWRHDPGTKVFDYPFVETAGRGQFVGVSLSVDHPLPGWFGEGDEKIWMDDQRFPFIGTGTEDYFGDAWGLHYLFQPSFGSPVDEGNRTSAYRWHFMDYLPFAKRFRMTIENYGPNGQGPRGQYDYASTAFWYQQEATPPFAQLKGISFIGGDDPHAPPKTMQYGSAPFAPASADAVRTYGQEIPFAQEAEDLLKGAAKAGMGSIVTDAKMPYEYNHERAVDFGDPKQGDDLGEFSLPVQEDGVYFPHLIVAPGASGVPALEIDGKRLEMTSRSDAIMADLEGVFLTRGVHSAKLVAGEGRHLVLDAIQLLPARSEPDAMEAESLKVVSVAPGEESPTPGPASIGYSAGRTLDWAPSREGAGFALALNPPPDLAYALGVKAVRGPDAPIIQAYDGGNPIGAPLDLYAPERKLDDEIEPLGDLPAGAESVEIRVVGANPKSSGRAVALDYFRYEPKVLGPETTPGVRARILRVRGGRESIQKLGPAWTDGYHLWIQPSRKGTTADIGLDVPDDGDYEIVVRLTQAFDYGIVQVSLDGTPLGLEIDGYSPNIVLTDPIPLGTPHLVAGPHVLRFEAIGQNADAKGYLMGIDDIEVVKK